jgi:hypothetical protein
VDTSSCKPVSVAPRCTCDRSVAGPPWRCTWRRGRQTAQRSPERRCHLECQKSHSGASQTSPSSRSICAGHRISRCTSSACCRVLHAAGPMVAASVAISAAFASACKRSMSPVSSPEQAIDNLCSDPCQGPIRGDALPILSAAVDLWNATIVRHNLLVPGKV